MRFRRDEKGSITVEAALVMPIFLLFVLFLIGMVRIVIADMALTEVTSNVTKEVTAHLYTEDYFLYRITQGKDTFISEGQKVIFTMDEIIGNIGKVYTLLTEGEEYIGNTENFKNVVSGNISIMEKLHERNEKGYDPEQFTPVLKNYAKDYPFLDPEKLNVIKVEQPNLLPAPTGKHSDAFLGITVKYEMSIPMPFTSKTFYLTKKAYERAWIGI